MVLEWSSTYSGRRENINLWKYGITDTVPTRTDYYRYNDTTEVVVELTLVYIGNLQVKRGGVSTVDPPPHYTGKRIKSAD